MVVSNGLNNKYIKERYDSLYNHFHSRGAFVDENEAKELARMRAISFTAKGTGLTPNQVEKIVKGKSNGNR